MGSQTLKYLGFANVRYLPTFENGTIEKKSTKSAIGKYFGIKRWYDNYLSNKVKYKVIPITKGKQISMKLSKLAKFRFWFGINSGLDQQRILVGDSPLQFTPLINLIYMPDKKLSGRLH